MKIYTGPFISWFGVYQLCKPLSYIGIDSSKVAEWLIDHTNLQDFFNKIYRARKRKVKIKLHNYDCIDASWDMAVVNLAIIKEYKKHCNGIPYVALDDIKEYPLLNEIPETDYTLSDAHVLNADVWNWVIDEIIWGFQTIVDQDKDEPLYTSKEYKEYQDRQQRALILYAKYMKAMWL